jgi:hypothetical protein
VTLPSNRDKTTKAPEKFRTSPLSGNIDFTLELLSKYGIQLAEKQSTMALQSTVLFTQSIGRSPPEGLWQVAIQDDRLGDKEHPTSRTQNG